MLPSLGRVQMVCAEQRRLLQPWKSKSARGGLCKQEAGMERKALLGRGKGRKRGPRP